MDGQQNQMLVETKNLSKFAGISLSSPPTAMEAKPSLPADVTDLTTAAPSSSHVTLATLQSPLLPGSSPSSSSTESNKFSCPPGSTPTGLNNGFMSFPMSFPAYDTASFLPAALMKASDRPSESLSQMALQSLFSPLPTYSPNTPLSTISSPTGTPLDLSQKSNATTGGDNIVLDPNTNAMSSDSLVQLAAMMLGFSRPIWNGYGDGSAATVKNNNMNAMSFPPLFHPSYAPFPKMAMNTNPSATTTTVPCLLSSPTVTIAPIEAKLVPSALPTTPVAVRKPDTPQAAEPKSVLPLANAVPVPAPIPLKGTISKRKARGPKAKVVAVVAPLTPNGKDTGETRQPGVECQLCHRTYSSQNALNRHNLLHTGEKPFQCSVCGKAFNQKGTLKTHQRLHTGEAPYKCKTCPRAFRHRTSFKIHFAQCGGK